MKVSTLHFVSGIFFLLAALGTAFTSDGHTLRMVAAALFAFSAILQFANAVLQARMGR